MNIEKIIDALENKQNDNILNLTLEKIKNINLNVLKDLKLSSKIVNEYTKALKYYYYVDEIKDLKDGSYIRWINLKDPDNLFLTKGAIFCDTIITDEAQLICKTFQNRFFQLKMGECLIFQKLTIQEKIILEAIHKLL